MQPTFSIAPIPILLTPAALLFGATLLVAVLRFLPSRAPRLAPLVAILTCVLAAIPVLGAAPAAFSGSSVVGFSIPLFRVGSLDTVIGFAVDRAGVVLAVAVLLLVVLTTLLSDASQRSATRTAMLLFGGAGATFAVLAEGLPTLFLGLGIAYGAHVLSPGADEVEAAPEGRARHGWALGMFAGSVGLAAIAAALLFWMLGGRWLDESRYLADYKPRFVVVETKDTSKTDLLSSPQARGQLTIVSHPGADVYLGIADESHLARSDRFDRTPFVRRELPAGLHSIAIAPRGGAMIAADGLEVALVDAVRVRPGTETTIVLAGPTVTFHELAPQVGASTDLATRRMGPVRASIVLSVVWAMALLALAASFFGQSRAARSSGTVGCAIIAAAALVSRFGAVAPIHPIVAANAALALALLAAATAWRGSIGAPAMALIGIAGLVDAPGAALVMAAAIGPGLAALRALEIVPRAVEAETPKPKTKKKGVKVEEPEPIAKAKVAGRERFIALLALAAMPLPFVGPFAGVTSVAVPQLFAGLEGIVVAVASVVAWAALAYAAGRALPQDAEVRPSQPTMVLAAVGLVAGPVAALLVQPWAAATERGWALVFVVGLAPWAAAFAVFARTRSTGAAPLPSSITNAGAKWATVVHGVRRAIVLVDTFVSFPLAWVDQVFKSKPGPTKPAPTEGES